MAKAKDEKQKDLPDIDHYQSIVDRAHAEMQYVQSHYKWLFASITVIVSAGIVTGAFLLTNNLRDMRADIKSQIDMVARDVQSRIEQEFDKEHITSLIEAAATAKVEQIAIPLIHQDVNEIVIPEIEAAKKKLDDINDTMADLEDRVAGTVKEQLLLSGDVTALRLFFDVRRGSRDAFEKLQHMASTANGKQADLAQALLDDTDLYYEELKLSIHGKQLISVVTGSPFNPPAEGIHLEMFNYALPSSRRKAWLNEVAERKLHYFVEELVQLVGTDKDLKVAANAAKVINQLVGEDFSCCPPFVNTLNWWNATGKSIEKYRSPFPEIERLFKLLESAKSDEVLAGLLKIVETRKGLADARFTIAKIYMERAERDKAIQQLGLIDEECEAHNKSLFFYAAMMAEEGRRSEAIKLLQKIKKYDPDKTGFAKKLSGIKVFETLTTEDAFKKLLEEQ